MTSATFGYHQLPNGYWIKDSDNSGPYVQSAPGVFGLAGQGLTATQLAATQSLVSGAWDVVVYGANPGGIMAAVAAAREGATVALVAPTSWIGGMTTGGLSLTDVNTPRSSAQVVGLAREFYQRVAKYYGTSQRWTIFWKGGLGTEPKIAQREFGRMLNEAGVKVIANAGDVTSCAKTGTRISSVTLSNYGVIYGKAFVDATYEGDLIAAAGCTTTIGREANATYSESHNGVAALLSDVDQFHASVDPYVTAGVPGSGFLPGISGTALGSAGSADDQVQAMCYRINLTKDAGIKVAFPEPASYDPLQFELLGRHAALAGAGWTTIGDIITVFQVALIKYDVLNHCPMSIDYISPESTEYITASRARRTEIEANARNYILGLLKFIRTDTRIPAAVRADVATYGFCADEWLFNDNFPPQIYVRCGRRLVGDFVLREGDITAQNAFTDQIAYGYYALDAHHVRRVYVGGAVKNEGKSAGGAYVGAKLPYRVLSPKVSECTNLLATFAVSASYAAHCAIRLEPISMAFGHAAGIACAWSSRTLANVQSMDVTYLQKAQNIQETERADGSLVDASGATYTEGTATITGVWTDVLENGTVMGIVSNKAKASTAVGATLAFAPNIRQNGPHRVWLKWPDDSSITRSASTPVTITHANGTTNLVVSQLDGTGDGGHWFYAGEYVFTKGSPSTHKVTVGTDGVGGSSVINAVKFIPAHSYDALTL